MNARIYALIGLIVVVTIIYLDWNYMPSGEGLMRNVLRTMVLGAVAIPGLYSLLIFLNGWPKQSPNDKTPPEDKRD